MKTFSKMFRFALPAFVLAAAVGMTTIGCGDDTTSSPADLAAVSSQDLTTPVTTTHDLAEHD
jgi:hypothetical protein